MWTWLDSLPSVHTKYYLDRVLVRRANTELVFCLMFHWIRHTDHRLVRVSLQLAHRLRQADYWKFNTSLLKL